LSVRRTEKKDRKKKRYQTLISVVPPRRVELWPDSGYILDSQKIKEVGLAMAQEKDYSSIKPLNETARKEAWPLVGMFLLGMAITLLAIYIAGQIANSLL
jgi:hypothetical protein